MKMIKKDGIKMVEVGDFIIGCSWLGDKMRIDKILSQEYFPKTDEKEEYWNIEFISKGTYHHYKNYFDGRKVINGSDRGKNYYDYLGTDVTDIFKKYGYK